MIVFAIILVSINLLAFIRLTFMQFTKIRGKRANAYTALIFLSLIMLIGLYIPYEAIKAYVHACMIFGLLF